MRGWMEAAFQHLLRPLGVLTETADATRDTSKFGWHKPAYLSSKSSSFADVALSTTMLRLATPLLLLATAHGALELTEDNWNSALAGKSAFVKFLAPW